MWFWRYHRQVDNIEWTELAAALKRQYKEVYNDYDIKNDIRRIKQGQNETFDEYYDSIMGLSDRLRSPMTEEELFETMIRNLKSEIRHELLHINISSVAELRKAVRKHEKFVGDVQTMNRYRQVHGRVKISQISEEVGEIENEMVNDELNEIQGPVQCWNCAESGHTYKRCVKHRTIFCYGCGQKNVYKLNCKKCGNSENPRRDVPRLKREHPQSTLRK